MMVLFALFKAAMGFLFGFLLSLSADSIAYFYKYDPSENVSYMQYFHGSELLTCAVLTGILTMAVSILFIIDWSKGDESTTD